MTHPPIKPFDLSDYPVGNVTQWFGENPDLYKRFGLNGHNGIDIVAPHGTPMYATEDCTVINVKADAGGYGKHVRLLADTPHRRNYHYEFTYGHCAAIYVKVGDKVKAGHHIADMGNTGFVISGATPYWENNPYAGTHLHLGVREVRFHDKGWSYPGSNLRIDIVNYDNGFKGSIDPRKYLDGTANSDDLVYTKLLTIRSLAQTLLRLLQARKSVV